MYQPNYERSIQMPTPGVETTEGAGNGSEPEAEIPEKNITMAQLSEIATKAYPVIHTVMNVPIMQKTGEVLSYALILKVRVRYRFW